MNKSRLSLLIAVVLCVGLGFAWAYHANVEKHRHSLDANKARADALLLHELQMSGDLRDLSEGLAVEMAENKAEIDREGILKTGASERVAILKRQHLSAIRQIRRILDRLDEGESDERELETMLSSAVTEEEYLHRNTQEDQSDLRHVRDTLDRLDGDRRRWQAGMSELNTTYAELEAKSR